MTERCINLTAAEARAWAAGATALIRPAGNEFLPFEGIATRWHVGDVLIGREAWRWDGLAVVYRAGYADTSTFGRLDQGWLPPSTMRKGQARHRRPVVSVRVCRAGDTTEVEWVAAGCLHVDDIANGLRGKLTAWVSVTMTEAA